MYSHRGNVIKKRPLKQKGVVLVVCLFMLILVTFIGLTAFKTSHVQTLLTANEQFTIVSFNDAERSLTEAEISIETQILNASIYNYSNVGDGYYNDTDVIDVHDLNWETASVETGKTGDDKFVVQYIGKKPLPGEDETTGKSNVVNSGAYVYTFSVTARSLGLKNTERVLQSIYVTSAQP